MPRGAYGALRVTALSAGLATKSSCGIWRLTRCVRPTRRLRQLSPTWSYDEEMW